MFDRFDDPIECWWRSDLHQIFPGKCTLFVGAGISMAGPTNLPSGAALTSAILDHLLDERAASEIREVFEQCSPILKKNLPRLEHVLDKTFGPIGEENFSRAGNPREVLKIFSDRTPNALHHAIANYLIKNRGWCITTNFDDCIERASSSRIPVHVLSEDQTDMKILHKEHGIDWGIIKLHGSIAQEIDSLGATLQQLQIGLAKPLQSVLNRIIQETDLLVVAGYSGTDHFDVNHWMRRRARETRTGVLWISHSESDEIKRVQDDTREPFISWSRVFRFKNMEGRTDHVLKNFLGLEIQDWQCTPPLEQDLKAHLSRLYLPTAEEKHINSAKLAAAIGLGQLAEESLRLFRKAVGNKNAAMDIEPHIYLARGWNSEALQWHDHVAKLHPQRNLDSREKFLRSAGKHLHTLWHFFCNVNRYRALPHQHAASATLEASSAALSIVKNLQRFSIFRTGFSRSLCLKFIHYIWSRIDLGDFVAPISLHGRLQTQNLLLEALLLDDDDDNMLSRITLSIHEQYWNHGPMFPSEHFIEKSTALEEDRLADVVLINLELASIILSLLRRRWPRGIHDVWREERATNPGRTDFLWGANACDVMFGLLFEASRIATVLKENKLHILISTFWLEADRILKGVSYWKAQRLYMAK